MPSGSDDSPSDLDLDLSEEHSVTAYLQFFLRTVYHLFYLAAPELEEGSSHGQSHRLSQGLFAAGVLVKTVQMVSLLYPVEAFMSDWGRFSLWTSIISFVRVDFLLVKIGLGGATFYAGAALVSVPMLLYLSLYRTLKRQSERKWRLRVFLFRVTVKLLSGVLYLPLLSVFLASQKYLDS